MRRLLACAAALAFCANVATANYTIPMFDLDDVPDTDIIGGVGYDLAAQNIPAGTYVGYSLEFDWSDPQGNPWSAEAEFFFANEFPRTSSTQYYAAPGNNLPGSDESSSPATIFKTESFSTFYNTGDPLWFIASQNWDGSTADWTNIEIELISMNTPAATAMTVPSQLDADLAVGAIDWYSFTLTETTDVDINTELSTVLSDSELALYAADGTLLATHDDISYPLNKLSRIETTLDAGEYYVAVGSFNSTFDDGFVVTGGSRTGAYTLQIVPEPATFALLAIGGLALLRRKH